MRTVIRVVLVLGSIGALALGTSVPVLAQYYYPLPRDYDEPRDYDAPRDYDGRPDHNMTRDYDGHRDHDGWRDHDAAQSDNGCPSGWKLRTLPRSHWRWAAHLERLSARLHNPRRRV